MTEKIIFYLILGISVPIVLNIITKSARRFVNADSDGLYRLKMHKLYGVVGIVGLIFGLFFLIILPLTEEKIDRKLIAMVFLMLVIFWGAGVSCLLWYKNHKLAFNNSIITVTNIFGKQTILKWSDITNIKFSSLTGKLIVSNKNAKFKIHQHMIGLPTFIEKAENKTKLTIKHLKTPRNKNKV